MAGCGPAPKPSGQRRRRHKPHVGAELPAEGYAGEFPPLARSYRDSGKSIVFLGETRRWYETWASSPMACVFAGTDWTRLAMLARVVDAFHRTPRAALLAEIRLQEALFGGSPLDRRRVGLTIASVEPVRDAQLVALDEYRRELGA
jgi:hypothetical protein